jgi:hypothetical protein
MNFCLPKYVVDSFLGKLKSGEITPEKLTEMNSAERNAYFSSIMGEGVGSKVNALFESKLLLKNQQAGIINWAKQITGIKPAVKRDLLSRVEKMTEILQPKDLDNFLGDLAAQRLGVGVTIEEAGKIADLAKTVSAKKELIPESSPKRSQERRDYGDALFAFQEYVKGLKIEAKALSLGELMHSPWQMVKVLSGGFKSSKASIDASFSLRQGYVTLINNPKVWGDAFAQSFETWGKELKGMDGIAPIKSDVFSRPNAINGKYQKLGVDIGIDSEEAYPESWPTKIPLLGRLYKASMSAYNGALLRMRADLADRFIEEAEAMGVTDLKESGIGPLVNSMTGRGRVPMSKGMAETLNAVFFSPRYFKAQLDVLSAGMTDPKLRGTPAQKKAATNLLRMIATMGGVLGVAKLLDEDSVTFDPRSTKFGKVHVPVGEKTVGVDVTAGFRSLIILASRLVPTMHNGKWGLWWVSSKGRYNNMWDNKYGSLQPDDFIVNFLEGKASPFARTGLNIYKQKKWDNEKPTLLGELKELVLPISLSNAVETVKESKDENPLVGLILSGLNMLGAGTTHEKPKSKKNSKPKWK